MPWLINSTQLDKFRKNQKNLVIFDASWHLPTENRSAKQEFIDKHIMGAQFFDIDHFNDRSPEAPHPNMLLLDEKILSEKIGALGIRNDYKIIFYDNSASHTACRALWMFQVFGHDPQLLYLLDGGLSAWEKYQGKIESGQSNMTAKPYQVKIQRQLLRTLSQMKTNLHNPTEQVIDLRHAVRFAGGPEPRPHIRPGHIPGSFSFPYTTLFDKEGLWHPLDKIRRQLAGIGIELDYPIISMCGTGMTAPILHVALDLLEQPQHAVYNGSWTEWGNETLYAHELSLDERPVKTCLEE